MYCRGVNLDYKAGETSFEKLVEQTDMSACQIFLDPMAITPPVRIKDLRTAGENARLKEHTFYVHSPFTINLAGTSDPKSSKRKYAINNAVTGLRYQADVATILGGGVVVHVGTCQDHQLGIETISDNIIRALKTPSKLSAFVQSEPLVILENAAGERNKIGSDLDDMVLVYNNVTQKYPDLASKLAFCLDTCHLFSAGYKMNSCKCINKLFDRNEIIDNTVLFHINDSQVEYNSKRDLHAPVYEGTLFDRENYHCLISNLKAKSIDFVFETWNPDTIQELLEETDAIQPKTG